MRRALRRALDSLPSPPSPAITTFSIPEPCRRARGPTWLRFGEFFDNYICFKMEGMPVWRCWKAADYYDVPGMVLFLFKCAGTGFWLFAHGPVNIDSFHKFQAARNAKKLTPVWGSCENVTAKGLHNWDTFDTEMGLWLGEDRCYDTVVLE